MASVHAICQLCARLNPGRRWRHDRSIRSDNRRPARSLRSRWWPCACPVHFGTWARPHACWMCARSNSRRRSARFGRLRRTRLIRHPNHCGWRKDGGQRRGAGTVWASRPRWSSARVCTHHVRGLSRQGNVGVSVRVHLRQRLCCRYNRWGQALPLVAQKPARILHALESDRLPLDLALCLPRSADRRAETLHD
jgi:hypothetical protein